MWTGIGCWGKNCFYRWLGEDENRMLGVKTVSIDGLVRNVCIGWREISKKKRVGLAKFLELRIKLFYSISISPYVFSIILPQSTPFFMVSMSRRQYQINAEVDIMDHNIF